MPTNNTKKTVLMTGANGFVGRHVVKQLEDEFAIKKLVMEASSDGICCDLSAEPSDQVIEKIGEVDQLIHLAALTPKVKEDNTLEKSASFYQNNLFGTLNLLKMIEGKKLKHIVYISTLDVYGLGQTSISEETPINPETYYSASKYAAEEACKVFCREQKIPLAILRLGHVYGPGEGLYKKVIPEFIRRALNNEPLSVYGKGSALRDFIFVGDIARAIAFVAKKQTEGTFNIVNGKSISILELAQMINSLCENNSGIDFPKKDFPEVDYKFSNKKLKSIGFNSKISLEEGLKKEINFAKNEYIH